MAGILISVFKNAGIQEQIFTRIIVCDFCFLVWHRVGDDKINENDRWQFGCYF